MLEVEIAPGPSCCGMENISKHAVFNALTALFSDRKMGHLMRSQTLFEGRWIFGILVALVIAAWFVMPWLSLIFLLLFFCTLAFFRDPDRAAPSDTSAILAAADGTVTEIAEVDETEVLQTKMRRVGIFLSIFDVHTNRAPVDGRIIYRQHRQGLCLDARRQDCSEKNESMTWAFKNPRTTVIVRQLTGAVARRIVAWLQVGDEVKKGDRFGMIRFGSRTEVYLPLTATVLVKEGDHVAGGSTIIARLPDQ
jgi:phosphatidylserine decarboxylase